MGTSMVIPESRMKVRLNGKEVAQLICRLEHPEEPSVGLLHNYRVFPSLENVKSIQVHPQESAVSILAQVDESAVKNLQRARSIDPCEIPVVDDPSVREEKAQIGDDVFPVFSRMAGRFLETMEVIGIFGSYQVAALADRRGRLVCQAGDVAMDVTIDRLIGKAFLGGIKLENQTLLISGRLRADTVGKAARHGISSLVTSSVVTSLALDIAMKEGIDIINAKEPGTLTVYGYHGSEAHPDAAEEGKREGDHEGLAAES